MEQQKSRVSQSLRGENRDLTTTTPKSFCIDCTRPLLIRAGSQQQQQHHLEQTVRATPDSESQSAFQQDPQAIHTHMQASFSILVTQENKLRESTPAKKCCSHSF